MRYVHYRCDKNIFNIYIFGQCYFVSISVMWKEKADRLHQQLVVVKARLDTCNRHKTRFESLYARSKEELNVCDEKLVKAEFEIDRLKQEVKLAKAHAGEEHTNGNYQILILNS